VSRVDGGAFAAKTGNGASHGDGTRESVPPPAATDAVDVHAAWTLVRGLPRTFKTQMTNHPGAVVAGVAASAFLLGALLGSKVGRMMATAAVGYMLDRLVDGPVGRQLGRHAAELLKNAATTA
jgi:hypothetical protein